MIKSVGIYKMKLLISIFCCLMLVCHLHIYTYSTDLFSTKLLPKKVIEEQLECKRERVRESILLQNTLTMI